MTNARRTRLNRELELLRAMCAGSTLLTSEIRTAPLSEMIKPPAGPERGGGAASVPPRRCGDEDGFSPPVVVAEDSR